MDWNKFTGTLPAIMFEHLGKLSSFKVNDNNLSGPIPSEIGLLSTLDKLFINNNNFSGTIPVELGNLNVTMMHLHENILLTGTIPSTLQEIPALDFLTLSNTSFSGQVPNGLCDAVGDTNYTCTDIGGLFSICYDVVKLNFTCSSTNLCGCECSAPCT